MLTGIINEEWRSISGYANYQVSNIGRVRNVATERILKPQKYSNRYLFVGLYKDKKQKPAMIHRLVAQEFIDNPDEKPCIDHIDHNKENNTITNLRWVSHSENNMNLTKRSTASSVFKGVCYRPQTGLWRAYINLHGKMTELGRFETEVEAAKAYNEKAYELFGEFAHLNVIPENGLERY